MGMSISGNKEVKIALDSLNLNLLIDKLPN